MRRSACSRIDDVGLRASEVRLVAVISCRALATGTRSCAAVAACPTLLIESARAGVVGSTSRTASRLTRQTTAADRDAISRWKAVSMCCGQTPSRFDARLRMTARRCDNSCDRGYRADARSREDRKERRATLAIIKISSHKSPPSGATAVDLGGDDSSINAFRS